MRYFGVWVFQKIKYILLVACSLCLCGSVPFSLVTYIFLLTDII